MPWFARRPSTPPSDPDMAAPGPARERKSGPLVTLGIARAAPGVPASFSGLSREGYRTNPVVYRCVRLLSETAASVPLRATGTGADAVPGLLSAAGPMGGTRPLEALYGHLAIAGSAYLEATVIGDRPAAIRALRPDRVSVERDSRGRTIGWRVSGRAHRGEGRDRVVRFDPVTHRSALMAIHLFDPLDAGAGRGPLEACATAVDIHNEGARWTRSLLGNAACPSGALVYSGGPGADRLSDSQFERLRDELSRQHTGAGSAGRPLLLEGGLDWRPMSLSPSDMDFIAARREAAREIALAFGVPPMLLGIPGDNTYANLREANLAFWRQTVAPLVAKTADAVAAWLGPWFEGDRPGEDLALAPDLDAVPALSAERDALWARLGAATFLTDAERRERAGLPPIPGGPA